QQGGMALVGGESGIGKTRLVMELAREAAQQGVHVLFGECLPGAPSPLQALHRPFEALVDSCLQRGPTEMERLLGRHGKFLASYVPALAARLGELDYPVAPDLPADRVLQRLCLALTDVLEAFAERQPLLLVLDDLQWADELTLAWLQFAISSRALA